MDFLDSLDLDTTHKKCHRVRSWYLYEQYKSLEKNQLDAAQILKNKSYQDKFLRQEIKERRARRNLCGKFGSCCSESRINKTDKSSAPSAPPSVDNDDLYESFSELYDEHLYDFRDNISRSSSFTSRNCEDFKSVDTKWQDDDNERVDNIIKNVCSENNLADDVKGELEIVKKNIADNINLQLDTVKENIECLEKLTKLGDTDYLPGTDSTDVFEQCESSETFNTVKEDKKLNQKTEKELFPTWAKLVAFAYETVQFNHGNILQPYVCPIKYAPSDSDISAGSNKCLTFDCPPKKSVSTPYKNAPKQYDIKKHTKLSNKRKRPRKLRWLPNREYQSENKLQHNSEYSYENHLNELKYTRMSEPWHSVSKRIRGQTSSGKSKSSIWPEEFSRSKFSDRNCTCRCIRNVVTPMLQLARYMETVLQDIQD